ncbi:MAG: SDR family oxidoreductase [Anaerolineae bacterium]
MSRIVILGATGGTGKALVEQAVKHGHDVVVVARNPDAVVAQEGNGSLTVMKGNVLDAASLVPAFTGATGIISAAGTGNARKSNGFYINSITTIVTAMRQAQVRRIVVIGSNGVVDNPDEPFWYRYFLKRYLQPLYDDMAQMEAYLRTANDIEWTVVRATWLRDTPMRGVYRIDERNAPRNGWRIGRYDVAHFMLDTFEQAKFIRKFPAIAY